MRAQRVMFVAFCMFLVGFCVSVGPRGECHLRSRTRSGAGTHAVALFRAGSGTVWPHRGTYSRELRIVNSTQVPTFRDFKAREVTEMPQVSQDAFLDKLEAG